MSEPLEIWVTQNTGEDQKCSGCNWETQAFYGVGTSEEDATARASVDPSEGYGNGQCSLCMLEEVATSYKLISKQEGETPS